MTSLLPEPPIPSTKNPMMFVMVTVVLPVGDPGKN